MRNICCVVGQPMPAGIQHSPSYKAYKIVVYDAIKDMVVKGIDTFYICPGRGSEMWCARIILSEKKINPWIRLICVVGEGWPSCEWSTLDQVEYEGIIRRADMVIQMHGNMLDRHVFMARRSKYLLDLDCDAGHLGDIYAKMAEAKKQPTIIRPMY